MEDLNFKYWTQMTAISSIQFCKEMLRLSADPYENVDAADFEARCHEYLIKVIQYDKAKILDEHIDELKIETPFPSDIHGWIHEYGSDCLFQPKHLMKKLAVIHYDDVTFEFLIEYGLLESDVEIYYGVKAISDNKNTTDDFAKKVQAWGEKWFEYIGKFKKITTSTKDRAKGKFAIDSRAHKFTNNINNGTFWLSWVRVNYDEDMEYVVNKLQNSVYSNFKLFLHFEISEGDWKASKDDYDHFDSVKEILKKNKNNSDMQDERYSDILSHLDMICQRNNQSIVQKDGHHRYKFSCDNFHAKIFIEYLFNPEHFKNTYNWANEYWNKKISERPRSFIEFVRQKEKESNNKIHWYSGTSRTCDCSTGKRRTIDRAWVVKTFIGQRGALLGSFFNQTIKFDDENGWKKIKDVMRWMKGD